MAGGSNGMGQYGYLAWQEPKLRPWSCRETMTPWGLSRWDRWSRDMGTDGVETPHERVGARGTRTSLPRSKICMAISARRLRSDAVDATLGVTDRARLNPRGLFTAEPSPTETRAGSTRIPAVGEGIAWLRCRLATRGATRMVGAGLWFSCRQRSRFSPCPPRPSAPSGARSQR